MRRSTTHIIVTITIITRSIRATMLPMVVKSSWCPGIAATTVITIITAIIALIDGADRRYTKGVLDRPRDNGTHDDGPP